MAYDETITTVLTEDPKEDKGGVRDTTECSVVGTKKKMMKNDPKQE
jgi:hypothetical protein